MQCHCTVRNRTGISLEWILPGQHLPTGSYIVRIIISGRCMIIFTGSSFKGNTSWQMRHGYRYQTLNQTTNISSLDAFLDMITSRIDYVSKNLDTDENESLSILYTETNSCDCRFYVALIEFMQYMFENEILSKLRKIFHFKILSQNRLLSPQLCRYKGKLPRIHFSYTISQAQKTESNSYYLRNLL